ncbi:TerD family protein [Candidatus Viridilinea mediisalina]|uniref:Cytoplasmic protein n=1 Tax=Candidatus Viridilinea mediisalina TaxID=2024553 RepID=A0A2A6RQA7_9CHLR|nr:TerD family protein [Candidatus Viridilinea mediisalina]PDW05119.1 cytoplasmic protein [Candidatus Viridilinea mediisalina]
MQQAIYIRHRNRVIVPPGDGGAPPQYLASLLKNLERLGFTASAALIMHLQTCSVVQLERLAGELVPALRQMLGAHVAYTPMYPNFPAQVMQTSHAELYLNAILHYLTHGRPPTVKRWRKPLIERTDLRVLDLGDEADFRAICTTLLAAKSALSPTDRADLAWFFQTYGDAALALIPTTVPLREHAALLGALLLRHTSRGAERLPTYVTTATDVLRLAVALSDGDVSLATPTKFRSFARAERRLLLELLEACGNSIEDMLRYPEPWKRLGERLHPGEYQTRFPQSAAAFDVIRNDRPVATFRSKVEGAIQAGQIDAALTLLRGRPGELARRLDHLLRRAAQPDAVVTAFGDVAAQVSTPVLLQALAHFAQRSAGHPLRSFFPKGEVAKAQVIANTLPLLDAGLCAGVVAICRETLVNRFRERPPLGKVFVDERLRDYPVPLTQRSASKALRTIPRGSRLPLGDGGTVRFFLWWKEGEVGGKPTGRVDIDLSAVLYDANWRYVEHISYTNLKSEKYRAAHSGDIVTAPNGACEFIDLEIESVVRYGGRYVVTAINAFTGQPFSTLPECYAGWMLRKEPQSGEVFEPQTVQQKIDVAANTRICIPVILDLVAHQVIWADLALRRNPRWFTNVEGNQKGMLLMGQALTTLIKPTLYDLFTLHAAARGTPVSREAASVVFAPDGTVTPFDIGVILADYL